MDTLHLIAFLILCCCLLASASLPAPPPLLIKDKSYTLWARMAVRLAHSSSTYEMVETYSRWQDRSVLKYRTITNSKNTSEGAKMPDSASVFADKRQVLVKSKRECFAIKSEVLEEFMNLNAFKNFTFNEAILGPSKVLHILLALERIKNFRSRVESKSLNRRNTPATSVVFNYDLDEKTEASLYYYEDNDSNLPNGLPFEIMLVTGPNKNFLISYKFERFDIQPEAPIFNSQDKIVRQFQTQKGPRVRFDALAVQPKFGCGKSMALALEEGPTNPLLSTEYRFSFQAKVSIPYLSDPFVHYVSYEPSIKTLRVEKVQRTKVSQTLVDYQAGELFHSMKRRSGEDSFLDHTMRMNDGPSDQPDATCIRISTTKEAVTLGEMLFGSNEVSYLGLAEVRGIEARAYMKMKSSWPGWYQQAISYIAADNNSSASDSNVYTRPNGDKSSDLTTVFYLSNNHKKDPSDEFSGQLLLIEITRELSTLNQKVPEITSIPVYEFSWKLASDAPNGQSMEQFFSLGDSCVSPAASGGNHYAQVKLLLERSWPLNRQDEADWLQETAHRNFAVIRMMQDKCGLPASMIYDIHSRLVRVPLNSPNSSEQSIHIATTLRALEHTRPITKLIRLGQGSLKSVWWHPDIAFKVDSFQSCYFLAAHFKFDAVFFYSPTASSCHIFHAVNLSAELMNKIIDFEASLPTFEIYRLEHRPAPNIGAQGDELTQLAHSEAKLSKLSRLSLINTKEPGQNKFLDVALKSVEVRELDRKIPVEVDQVELADTNKFLGVGLVASEESELNRLIQPDRMEALEWSGGRSQKLSQLTTEMTTGWCEAECLADFECKSYSVCLRNSKVECVISKVDFRSPYMLTQLAQLRDKKMEAKGEIKLKIDRLNGEDTLVPVVRRPSCELNNKSYRKLFIEAKKNYIDVLRRRLHPVSGREQCAKLCADGTIGTLRFEVKTAHEINEQVYSHPESHPDEIRDAYHKLKSSNLNLCATFLYLDRMELLSLSKGVALGLERLTGMPEDDWTKNGYCILNDVPSDVEIEELKKADPLEGPLSRLDMMVERFDFDFNFMFEKHHDVSLATGPLSDDLRDALSSVQASEAQQTDYARLREHLNEGNNMEAVTLVDDPRDCLRTCFLQLSALWPACKSVDVFEMDYKYAGKETYCFHNSQTLRELLLKNRNDLIRSSLEEQTRMNIRLLIERVTHYEPKAGFIGESLGVMSELQVREAAFESVTQNGHHLSIGSLGLMFTILLALIVGASIGLTLGGRVLALRGELRQDVETLVKSNEVHLGELATISDSYESRASNK